MNQTFAHQDLNAVIRQHSDCLASQLRLQRENLFPPGARKTMRKFTSGEAAALLGVTDSYLRKLSLDGKGPSPELTADLMDVVARSGADMSHDWMRYALTRHEPQDAPQNRIVAFLRTMYGDAVLNAPIIKSTAISDAGMTKQTLYEVERRAFTRTTYDRASESLNALNDEIADLIQKTWARS